MSSPGEAQVDDQETQRAVALLRLAHAYGENRMIDVLAAHGLAFRTGGALAGSAGGRSVRAQPRTWPEDNRRTPSPVPGALDISPGLACQRCPASPPSCSKLARLFYSLDVGSPWSLPVPSGSPVRLSFRSNSPGGSSIRPDLASSTSQQTNSARASASLAAASAARAWAPPRRRELLQSRTSRTAGSTTPSGVLQNLGSTLQTRAAAALAGGARPWRRASASTTSGLALGHGRSDRRREVGHHAHLGEHGADHHVAVEHLDLAVAIEPTPPAAPAIATVSPGTRRTARTAA